MIKLYYIFNLIFQTYILVNTRFILKCKKNWQNNNNNNNNKYSFIINKNENGKVRN